MMLATEFTCGRRPGGAGALPNAQVSRWPSFGIGVAVIAVLAGMVGGSLSDDQGDPVPALRAFLAASEPRRAAQARYTAARAALWPGESLPDAAEPHYREAERRLAGPDCVCLYAEPGRMHRWADLDPKDLAKVRRAAAPVFQAVIRGARASRGRERGTGVSVHLFWNLILDEVDARLADGDDSAAVTLALAGMVALADVHGFWMVAHHVASLWNDERLGRLSPAGARELADGLGRLDDWIEPAIEPAVFFERPVRRALLGARAWGGVGARTWTISERMRALGSGFDPALAQVRALHAVILSSRLLGARPPTNSIEARLEQLRRFQSAAARSGGESANGFAERLVHTEVRVRESIARVRFVRIAALFHARFALPALADPFADSALVCEIAGDRAVVRSAGSFTGNERYIERR